MNKAVFLDRDGTVTEEVGYLTDLSKLQLIPGAAEAIKRLNDAGYRVILITNQSGVARGFFPESQVQEAHERLGEMLAVHGARLDAIYYCPHHPRAGDSPYTVACDCRKPGTGLIERAVHELVVDPKQSFMIGDKWIDVEVGQRAGLTSVLVSTGFASDDPGNPRPEQVRDPDFAGRDLRAAVDWILEQRMSS